tara:strand:+ start:242 stop:967 length:726 start_codon:yes stop_codon:yes gene_type:complete
MNLSNCSPIEYLNDNISWNNNSTNIIQDMNTFIPENKEIKEVFQIKEDLINDLTNNKLEMKNIDIKEHEEKIIKFNDSFKDLLVFFKKQQDLVLKKEQDLKEYYDKLELDSEKLTDFTKFLADINNKYKDFEATSINQSILEVSKKIKENSKGENYKKEYEKELYILNYYFNNFLKTVNNGNLGTTCSLCLQRNVDTYMNPCGHTGCSQCINELKERMGEYNCNCFICRKKVIKFNALYFV